jgi:EAL domain-containing protein (putative c-di-GMP-specific phosphodiesterase class I)
MDVLKDALTDSGLAPEGLEVELTESAAMVDFDHTRRMFASLADLGVSVAIDDFGTGYASMSYLLRLPFSKVKIDREFVSHVDTRRGEQAICSAVIALGHGLGLRVLAEGVERREELQYLAERGCDQFQGYYFSQPVSAWAIQETLSDIEMRIAAGADGIMELLPQEAQFARAG